MIEKLLVPKIETHTVIWNGKPQARQFICLHQLMEDLPSVQVGCVDLDTLVSLLKPHMKQSAADYQRDERDAA